MYEGSGPHPIRMPERFYGELLAPTPTISAPDGLHPRRTRDAPTAIPCPDVLFVLFCFGVTNYSTTLLSCVSVHFLFGFGGIWVATFALYTQ